MKVLSTSRYKTRLESGPEGQDSPIPVLEYRENRCAKMDYVNECRTLSEESWPPTKGEQEKNPSYISQDAPELGG